MVYHLVLLNSVSTKLAVNEEELVGVRVSHIEKLETMNITNVLIIVLAMTS